MMRNGVRDTKQRPRRAPMAWSRGSLVTLAFYLALSGCASLPAGEQRDTDDPLEPLNRAVFDTNGKLDDAFIRPLAEAYRAAVPEFVRDRIRSVFDNLAEPRIFANDVLQRRADAAAITLGRFAVNSVAGVGGMFDVATAKGLPRQTGDFGQTLSTFGVPSGPYLVLLFFGPSNFRDALGLGVDLFTTPPALWLTGNTGAWINFGVGTIDGMDLRSRNIETLDEIKASALDYYANLKSLDEQKRAAEIREANGGKEAPEELTDPGAPASAPAPPPPPPHPE